MGFFDTVVQLIDDVNNYMAGPGPDPTYADLDKMYAKRQIDRRVEMEEKIENEKDPKIKKILQYRYGQSIYEWEDVYEKYKK